MSLTTALKSGVKPASTVYGRRLAVRFDPTASSASARAASRASGQRRAAVCRRLDAEVEMIAVFNNLTESGRKNRSALLQSVLGLSELHDSIMPTAEFQGSVAMSFDGLIEWASKLEQAPIQECLNQLEENFAPRCARLAITAASSASSTGFGTCIWYPARSA